MQSILHFALCEVALAAAAAPMTEPFILMPSIYGLEACVESDTRVAVDSAALKGGPAGGRRNDAETDPAAARVDFFFCFFPYLAPSGDSLKLPAMCDKEPTLDMFALSIVLLASEFVDRFTGRQSLLHHRGT